MNRNLYIIFVMLVFSLFTTLGLILWKELNPEWKDYQKTFFHEEAKKVATALGDAAGTQRTNLLKRLRYLRHPRYNIRQILLKDGDQADRCITCHLDLKQLEKKHSQIDRFPFEQYGCTVCHGGVGRSTGKSRAHSTLRIPRRPLFEYLQARAAGNSTLDLFRYRADGKPISFTGSKLCLRCHLSSHPKHVARWRKLKFKPVEKVKNKLNELRKSGLALDEIRCLGCHTTAFNERNGHYLENQVTCESCHGPGSFYADLMSGGRARDGAKLARANILETRSDRVCLNCHKPGRHIDYEGEDIPPTLIAAYLGGKSAPEMNGVPLDNTWDIALETKVSTWKLGDGPPQPGAAVFIRAVYDDTNIYFVFRWRDKTRHDKMGQWRFTGGQWRAEVQWPDALALHWQATVEVDDFDQGGCAVLCHSTGRFKEFPRMATRKAGALVDEWYWNAFTYETAGRPGDGFLDRQVQFIPSGSSKPAFRWAPPEISAAHASDDSGARNPDTVGGVPLILNAEETDGKQPITRFYLEGGKRVPLQLSKSDEPSKKFLPLYLTGVPEGGNSADIHGRSSWAGGYWVLELSRALQTPDKQDVRFDPSEKSYSFGLAVWDGAAGNQHQVSTIVKLRFRPAAKAK